MAKAVHTMVRGLDLDRSVTFRREDFGLTEADRFDFDDSALAYPSDGHGRLAISFDDLEAGFEPRLVTLEKDGGAVGEFFFAADPDGDQIEVLQRGGLTL